MTTQMSAYKSEIKTVLAAARELLSDAKKWTKGYYAKDASGVDVEDSDPEAVCFCSMGALAVAGRMVCSTVPTEVVIGELHKAMPFGEQSVALFNDRRTTTHADVLAAFDRAIASLES